MNYIKELNGFREWLLSNDLSANAVALWYTLMSINNSARWKQKFNAPNAIVRQLSGLSKQGLLDARAKLKEQHLITFEKGRRGKAAVYEMISLCQSPDEVAYLSAAEIPSPLSSQSLDQSSSQSPDDSLDDIPPVHKQKEKQARRGEETLAELFRFYEQNIGKIGPAVKRELEQWTRIMGASIVKVAISQTATYGGQTFSYLEKVLREWQAAELTTVEAVQAYTEEKKASRNRYIAPFPKQKERGKASLFDALREEV